MYVPARFSRIRRLRRAGTIKATNGSRCGRPGPRSFGANNDSRAPDLGGTAAASGKLSTPAIVGWLGVVPAMNSPSCAVMRASGRDGRTRKGSWVDSETLSACTRVAPNESLTWAHVRGVPASTVEYSVSPVTSNANRTPDASRTTDALWHANQRAVIGLLVTSRRRVGRRWCCKSDRRCRSVAKAPSSIPIPQRRACRRIWSSRVRTPCSPGMSSDAAPSTMWRSSEDRIENRRSATPRQT